jgi:hypothetical protein
MLVFQNELYIAGDFHTSTGDPGNCIAKWNGTSWSSVGTGLNAGGQLFCITAFQNEIYVGGSFLTIAGVAFPFIAKWNGINWNGLGSAFNNGVECFAPHGNDLFIGGGFWKIDNDTMLRITRYSPPLGIEENSLTTNFSISANPFTETLNVSNLKIGSKTSIIIYNLMGGKIFEKEFSSFKSQEELNLSFLQQGVYFLNVKGNGESWTKKIVKM